MYLLDLCIANATLLGMTWHSVVKSANCRDTLTANWRGKGITSSILSLNMQHPYVVQVVL